MVGCRKHGDKLLSSVKGGIFLEQLSTLQLPFYDICMVLVTGVLRTGATSRDLTLHFSTYRCSILAFGSTERKIVFSVNFMNLSYRNRSIGQSR